MTTVRSKAPMIAVLVTVLALLAESILRLESCGFTAAALGRWRPKAEWATIRALDAEGPRPIPDGWGKWALAAGDPPIDYRFDGIGLRVPAAGAARDTRGDCSVLVIGDSNAFGYGVTAEQAYPHQLYELLAARGVRASVANGGIAGTNVSHIRRWLERLLVKLDPDVVIVTVSPWSMRLDPEPTGMESDAFPDKFWRWAQMRSAWLLDHSALADRIWRRGSHLLNAVAGWPPSSTVAWEVIPLLEPPEDFERRWAAAEHEIERMAELVREEKRSRMMLVFVPLDVQISTRRNRLYRYEQLPYPAYGFSDRDYTSSGRRFEVAVAALAARLDVEAFDMTDSLRRGGDAVFLPKDYHLSAEGYRLAANILVAPVADRCVSRPAPTD